MGEKYGSMSENCRRQKKAVVTQKITLPDSADIKRVAASHHVSCAAVAPWHVWARSITVQVTVPTSCVFKLPWMAWQMVPTRRLWQRQKLKAYYGNFFLLRSQELSVVKKKRPTKRGEHRKLQRHLRGTCSECPNHSRYRSESVRQTPYILQEKG